MKSLLLFLIMVTAVPSGQAQDSPAVPKKFEVQGYLKNLQIIGLVKNEKPSWNSIIHNRINAKWRINGHASLTAEVRNRIFLGEDIRQTGGFTNRLRNPNEYFNLQKVWIENRSMVFHSNIERLYFDYHSDKIAFRAGRQRINWGMTTTWNPNDIFNTYNFLDFDYAERPGADGVKVSYKISPEVNTEIAYTNSGTPGGDIAAAKLSYNRWNYDWQVITGLYQRNLTVGLGWAGAVKSVGFKGEAQYFNLNGGLFNLAVEADYMFKTGWYVNTGVLFTDHGITDQIPIVQAFEFIPSPERLMPTKWTVIGTVAKELNPLLSVRSSIVFSPGTNLLILYPSLKYNIMPDFDLDFILQSFFARGNSALENLNNNLYIKATWNF
ncbi:hypothetical protein QGN23_04260 [Chryseobacterium gotjawalense]|uniref:Porin n=1 Tax=Chryseobacterium gotjawalense TaxID=3042315 RepID=A0ABY8REU9_9FLAO|nr:hypothetical protein [Chryseobacterium sp. wdc7]WHF52498.1 hypothetical protein QGN23_04260 [Chryseobacterium sp. wdc7]